MTASKHDRTNAVLTHFARADLPTFPDFKTTPLAEDHELSGRAKAALRTHYINALRDASWSDFAFKPAPLARPPLTAAGGLTTTSHRPAPASSNFVERRHVVEGLRLLTTLAWATRTILPRPLPPYDLPKMFIGKRLVLTIDHQKKGGITGLIVRACGPV